MVDEVVFSCRSLGISQRPRIFKTQDNVANNPLYILIFENYRRHHILNQITAIHQFINQIHLEHDQNQIQFLGFIYGGAENRLQII